MVHDTASLDEPFILMASFEKCFPETEMIYVIFSQEISQKYQNFSFRQKRIKKTRNTNRDTKSVKEDR